MSRISITRRGSAAADAAASEPEELRRRAGRPVPRRSWRAIFQRPLRAGDGIWLEPAGPVPGELRGGWVAGPVLAAAAAAFAAAQYAIGRPVAPVAWLAIAPVLGSLVLRPLRTAVLAGWTVLLGLGLALEARGPAGRLASSLAVLVLLVGDTRGKGLPAVRLASVTATSFRDACAEPGLSLMEVARSVDLSVTRTSGEEDFVTAVFAELDPRGWIQLVNCGHPAPLRLSTEGELLERLRAHTRHRLDDAVAVLLAELTT